MDDIWKIRQTYFWNKLYPNDPVLFKEVLYLNSLNDNTLVYLINELCVTKEKFFRISDNMGEVIKKMNADDFYRISKCYYANMEPIIQLTPKYKEVQGVYIEYPGNIFLKVSADEAEKFAVAYKIYRNCRPALTGNG